MKTDLQHCRVGIRKLLIKPGNVELSHPNLLGLNCMGMLNVVIQEHLKILCSLFCCVSGILLEKCIFQCIVISAFKMASVSKEQMGRLINILTKRVFRHACLFFILLYFSSDPVAVYQSQTFASVLQMALEKHEQHSEQEKAMMWNTMMFIKNFFLLYFSLSFFGKKKKYIQTQLVYSCISTSITGCSVRQ